ncbi:MAG: 50S ribosomal protein L23 [Oscillospiraceae bacterium]|nr:50S ribosomal protein L23 [Oscillospiraceae bacterium]
MTKTPQDIILAPIITERSMEIIELRKYTFRVAKGAGKIEIGKAVEALFPGTKVQDVNTMNVRGRLRRRGRDTGYTASWKKAIVTLKEGSKGIEFFESML